jgi:hypothetical protein
MLALRLFVASDPDSKLSGLPLSSRPESEIVFARIDGELFDGCLSLSDPDSKLSGLPVILLSHA